MMWAAVGMRPTFYSVLIGGLVSLSPGTIMMMQEWSVCKVQLCTVFRYIWLWFHVSLPLDANPNPSYNIGYGYYLEMGWVEEVQ